MKDNLESKEYEESEDIEGFLQRNLNFWDPRYEKYDDNSLKELSTDENSNSYNNSNPNNEEDNANFNEFELKTSGNNCNQIPRYLKEIIFPKTKEIKMEIYPELNNNQKQFLNGLSRFWKSKTSDDTCAYLIKRPFSVVISHYNECSNNIKALSDENLKNLMEKFKNNEDIICKRYNNFINDYKLSKLSTELNNYSNLQKDDLKIRIKNINELIQSYPLFVQNIHLQYSNNLSTNSVNVNLE